MSQIESVHARQILDSRGNPTVEVEVALRSGAHGPRRRPVRRLDGRVRGDRAARRRRRVRRQGRHPGGRRTSTARSRTRSRGHDAADQAGLDRTLIELDGTPNKSRLGANAILGVSLASARSRGGRGAPAAVALSRRRRGARPARADDERAQRRRARRQLGRLPGVHDRPGRRADRSRRRCAWAPRCSTRSRRRCTTAAWAAASATRAASPPTWSPTRRRWQR